MSRALAFMRGFLRSYREPLRHERIEADYHLNLKATTIPVFERGVIIPLIEAKMLLAEQHLSQYLSVQLWPRTPWYARAWFRVRDAALVLVGCREAVTHEKAVRLHIQDTDEDEDE